MNHEIIQAPKKKKSLKFNFNAFIISPYFVILSFLILLPMLIILFYSIMIQADDLPIYRITLSNYSQFFSDAIFVQVLGNTLRIAIITTLGTILVGYPLAYFISKRKPHIQATLILLVTIPMWINMLLRTLAIMQIFDGPILNIAKAIGFHGNTLLGSDFVVVFGMVYMYLPFMVLPIYAILSKLDRKLLEASQDLGASKLQSFVRVILPLSIPGILSGVTIVLLTSATALIVPKYLGEGKYILIGGIIENEFIVNERWSFGSAISIILLIVIMVLVIFTNRTSKNNGGIK